MPLEPGQGRRRSPTGDQQLGARVGGNGAYGRDARFEQRQVTGRRCAADAEEDEIERSVDVDREPPSPTQVVDLVAADLLQPARQGVVAGQSRDHGQGLDPRDRDDVRRVPIVRERPSLSTRRGRDQGAAIAGRGQRDRTRAEDDEPARTHVLHELPEAIAERPDVGRATDDRHVPGARRDETAAVVVGQRRPLVRTQRVSGPDAGSGSGWRIRTATGGIGRV